MTFQEFCASLSASSPPQWLSPALVALWWDAKADWKRAHELAQDDAGRDGSWVHAYLHRKEGDLENGGYWYRRAGKPLCRETLEEEWRSIARDLTEESQMRGLE
jgi:hypothetical protein